MPKISILIPVYNQEAWVGACVRSALAQDYPDLEVIVSDNASSDGTERIVRGLLSDPRLTYSRSTVNLGRVGNYRRLLYELATGELALVLDGDDMLTNPGYTATAAALLAENPDVVLAFGKILQGETAVTATVCNDGLDLARVLDGTAFFLAHPPFGRVGLFHLTALYRRAAAIEAGIYERDLLSVDYDAFYRMIIGRKLAFTDAVAGLWRQHGANHSQRYDVDAFRGNFAALVGPYQFARDRQAADTAVLRRWLRLSCAALYLISLKAAIRRGKLGDAARFTADVLRIDPLIPVFAVRNLLARVISIERRTAKS